MMSRLAGLALIGGVVLVISTEVPINSQEAPDSASAIRLLPAAGRELSGRVLFEALLIEPEPWWVVFYVDGIEAARKKLPPWEAKLRLDSPPREQIVRVEVEDRKGLLLGSDELVVNRPVRPLRVSIDLLEPREGSVDVGAVVSVPDEVELVGVGVYLNENQMATLEPSELEQGRVSLSIDRATASPTDYVRIEGRLADGRTVEDVELVEAAGFSVQAYHALVPSFGEWGFVLGARQPIEFGGTFYIKTVDA